jgi:peptide subunit release factor 1 (eRF1)
LKRKAEQQLQHATAQPSTAQQLQHATTQNDTEQQQLRHSSLNPAQRNTTTLYQCGDVSTTVHSQQRISN